MFQIKRLTDDLGLNLAGVEVILRMANRIVKLEAELEKLRSRDDERPLDPHVARLRAKQKASAGEG